MIKIEGQLVEVTPDVYYAYFRMERQDEKRQAHDVVSYDAIDDREMVGSAAIPDLLSPGMEDMAISQELKERLHHAVESLPRAKRELIKAIYFDGLSEREYAKMKGISQMGANKQRRKILSKLKCILGYYRRFLIFCFQNNSETG